MKSAQDYPVEFGYGAKDGYYYGPNGIVGPYHKGNDRYTPERTKILIKEKLIGLTGSTGLVGGPHLHTQAGFDKACQNTFNPTPLDFKPGIVVVAGFGSQWGNYITLKVGNRYITYAHLNKVYVKKGDKVGEDMYKGKSAKFWYERRQATYKVLELAREQRNKLKKQLSECKKQGPESNDQALKDSLYDKIKVLFGKK